MNARRGTKLWVDGAHKASRFIDPTLCTTRWHVVTAAFLFFIPKTYKNKEFCRKEKHTNSAKHFTLTINLFGGLISEAVAALLHSHNYTHAHTCKGGIFPEIG